MKTSDRRIGGYIGVRNLFNKLYKVYGTGFGGGYAAGTVIFPACRGSSRARSRLKF